MDTGDQGMKWLGMQRRTSNIDPRPGAATFAVNNRLGTQGENRRRAGNSATNIPKQSGAVLNIAPPIGPAGGIIVFPTGGTIYGYQDPLALWDDRKIAVPPNPNWNFPVVPCPANFVLPPGHTSGSVVMYATPSTSSPGFGVGVIFSVFFDTVLSYTSACMESGSDEFAIPNGVLVVDVTAAFGCNFGSDPTGAEASAYGTT
jgi:hypothetical protein